MTKKVLLVVLAFTLVAAMVFTACTPARRPYDNPNQYDNMDTNRTGYTGAGANPGTTGYGTGYETGYGNRFGTTAGTYPNTGNNVGYGNYRNTDENAMRADQISNVVNQIQGVENATVVVTGNTAYVGIDLSQNPRTGNERDIKREVAQVVKSAGRDINTVYVSTEVDFMDRLRNVGEGLRNGRPVDTFTTELNEMVRRITPARW